MLGSHILRNTSAIIGLLIAVFILQFTGAIDTRYFCLSPVDTNIWRIFTAPLLHGGVGHLVSNITVLMVTLPILFSIYKRYAWFMIACGYIFPMVFVCVIGVSGYGLGISGLVYANVWFLIFAGLKSKNVIRFLIAIGGLIMYAGSLIGATPAVGPGIGWTAHLGGVLAALVVAIMVNTNGKIEIKGITV